MAVNEEIRAALQRIADGETEIGMDLTELERMGLVVIHRKHDGASPELTAEGGRCLAEPYV